MNSKQNIITGEYYRHKNMPDYGLARVIKIWPPKRGVNPYKYSIAECEWALSKDASFGLIKYFKLSDLIR